MSDFPSASYDAWKTRSPDDEFPYSREPDEFHCEACNDTGWIADGDRIEPCYECGGVCPIIEDAYDRAGD